MPLISYSELSALHCTLINTAPYLQQLKHGGINYLEFCRFFLRRQLLLAGGLLPYVLFSIKLGFAALKTAVNILPAAGGQ